MNAAFTTEEFEVTLLTDADFNISWKITAETPEQALEKAMGWPCVLSSFILVTWVAASPLWFGIYEADSDICGYFLGVCINEHRVFSAYNFGNWN